MVPKSHGVGCPVLRALPRNPLRRVHLRHSLVEAITTRSRRISHLSTRIVSRMCPRPHRPPTVAHMTTFRTPQAPQTSPMLSTSIQIRTSQVTRSRRPLRHLSAVRIPSLYITPCIASPPIGQSILAQTLSQNQPPPAPPNPIPPPIPIVEVETPAFKAPPVVKLSEAALEPPKTAVEKVNYEELSKEETKQNLNMVFSKLPPPPPPPPPMRK